MIMTINDEALVIFALVMPICWMLKWVFTLLINEEKDDDNER